MANWTDEEMNGRIEELNLRPRKRLDRRTPYEVYYGVRLLLGLANLPSKKDIKNYGNELIEVPLISSAPSCVADRMML